MALFRFTPRRCLELQVSLTVAFFLTPREDGFRTVGRTGFPFELSVIYFSNCPVRNSKFAMLIAARRRRLRNLRGGFSSVRAKETLAEFPPRSSIDRCDEETVPSTRDRGSGCVPCEFVDRRTLEWP